MVRIVIDIQENNEAVDTHVYRLDGNGEDDVPTQAENIAAESIQNNANKFIESIGGFADYGEVK